MISKKVCSPESPYSKERDGADVQWFHIDVHEVGEQEDGYPGGDIVTYECRTCGITWKTELPQ